MSQARAMRQADEPLEPELLRLIEALARAHAREDYAAAQAAASAAKDH